VSDSKFTNKALHYSTAQYEVVQLARRSGPAREEISRRKRHSSEELLFCTLPYALAADSVQPLAAWVRYFAETEP
jgi:hypothetical protein